MKAYLTGLGSFLPGPPVTNDEMEDYLGRIHGKPSRARLRILKQNGIQSRHYAIDKQQRTLYSNAQMAALAIRNALENSSVNAESVDFLAAATAQGDLPLPGFASMVHGELQTPPCEIASLHGVCASGMMALRAAALQVEAGHKRVAVSCASEFPSRLFKSTRFEAQGEHSPEFDTEFLRWMLSDGAGAAIVEPEPRGLSLEIEWMELRSFANRYSPCMYVGPSKNGHPMPSWLDYESFHEAANQGAINLRQDIRMLDDVVRCAVDGALRLMEQGRLDPNQIDWLLAHYSSHVFRQQSYELAWRGGLQIPYERWFTNLYTKGNVGSASLYVLLDELYHSGKLQPGQRIFCLIPESGRFLFAYMLLKVVEGPKAAAGPRKTTSIPMPRSESPSIQVSSDPQQQRLVRELARVWIDFEDRLARVPAIARLYNGDFTVDDYRRLLFNLRQQVIDGSRWIARAASNITAEYFPVRSAFISHTSDEHRDYEMIERDFVSVGGTLEEIRGGRKNIGSEALSSYVLQRASRENPFDLIGAMFIVEGLGQRVARGWGERIREVLDLRPQQVSFLLYHSVSDVKHFERLDLAVAQGMLTAAMVDEIVKCAKVTARLYALQLEELDQF
ncbi:MAG: iron-containing redox enzyme family protein [Acidobacteria bacterium]|nr:iron-containing redox enzyme family protein [Acidobacteriota bacterium]